ncbi:MAG: serine phosphatase RsbU (regulator of sigma subunit)/tetratricopeptide (TPR) repeat protein [Arenicella sp.]|jgi:serine phosphatase RsbU (regulator of sigma subunit)/tetratricopeptide (TPR) repeat protein
MFKLYLSIAFSWVLSISFGQLSAGELEQIQSFKKVVNSNKHDTLKLTALKEWDLLVYVSDPELDFILNERMDSICVKNLKSDKLTSKEKESYLRYRGFAQNSMGVILYYEGNYKASISHYDICLKIYDEIDFDEGRSMVYNNLGNIYSDLGDFDNALSSYKKAYNLNLNSGEIASNSDCLNNIGTVFFDLGKLDSSKFYFEEAMKLYEINGDSSGIATCMGNIGSNYQKMGEYALAEEYFKESLKINHIIGRVHGLASDYHSLAQLYFDTGLYSKSEQYALTSLEYSEESEGLVNYKEGLRLLYRLNKKKTNFEDALSYLEQFHIANDSLTSVENERAVMQQNYEYEYDKKVLKDSLANVEKTKLQDAELATEKSENKRQKQLTYFLYIGIAIISVFAVFIFNRFRSGKRQNTLIEKQKIQVDTAFQELELKNREITDSILYAKRIQSAILPPNKLIKECLPESFVLYKPKDIVAGDFYWIEKSENRVFFAAADCTGHGVPGAMVSVVCNNGLNRAVREYKIREPGKILDKAREIVIQEFEKSEEEVKDGMDIALCSLEGLTLKYSGANNPLWVFKKKDSEFLEIKADKQPIGKFGAEYPFNTHEIQLEKGDMIYVFSDGYADQFGGERGKKMKSKNFKVVLANINQLSIETQKERLDQHFKNWQGSLEQLDDVCIIGIRV